VEEKGGLGANGSGDEGFLFARGGGGKDWDSVDESAELERDLDCERAM
jgi:hypothetical protein